MPRSQKNDNFIDKTFTVLADIILKILPTTKEEKRLSATIEMVCQHNQKVSMPKL